MSKLRIEGISRTFAAVRGGKPVQALQPVDLSVAANDFITILGPSGCGKSTLLRIVAGLEAPSTGQVLLDGKTVTRPGPDRGMVFQSYTLFPWLTVAENIGFGLRERGMPERERNAVVASYVDLVGLKGFENHWPKQLSMQELLLGIWERRKKTVLFVTHDIEEAIFMASRVIVMSARPGRIKSDVPVDLPHPRHYTLKTSPEFSALKAQLTEDIRIEAMRTAQGQAAVA
ncbi:MAG: ABC transporter ATP-binding protein [Mesorhizobium sp.]|nr:ABC transporter ATP-binding protein [Mesorhizobium sp.]